MLEKLKRLKAEEAMLWSAELLAHAAKRGYSQVLSTSVTIAKSRPHDVLTQNSLHFMTYQLPKDQVILPLLHERKTNVISYTQESDKKIQEFAWMRIQKGSIIATYGYSSFVYEMLLATPKKNFTVHVIDRNGTGRVLSKRLAKANIKVVYFEESAARFALKHADVLFLPAHTLTSKGHAIASMGSELIAETALLHNCKVYVLCHGWQFDWKNLFSVEEDEGGVSWKNAPKNITVNRFRFETLNDDSFTAIITEVGAHRPGYLVKELLNAYPWMKKNWLP